MSRQRWIQVNGQLIPADEYTQQSETKGATILPDLPDFRSPIDGTIVRGRAGLRDHCKRHNVVPTADLAGLPTKLAHNDVPLSREYREETKRIMARIIDERKY